MHSFRRRIITIFLLIPLFLSAQSKITDYYKFKDSSIHIEGIATGTKPGTFYFGGVNTGELYELNDSVIRAYSVPPGWPQWSLLGMKTDPGRQLLFIARAALSQSSDTTGKYHASDVIVFDLRSKTFTNRFPMISTKETVVLNDIAIALNGKLLVSNGGTPGGVYELNTDNGIFHPLNTKGIRSPQGVVALDTVIYIASYTQGLFQYSIAGDTSVPITINNLVDELHFLDGLSIYNNKLIGICNGNRRSVVSIDLRDFKGTVLADLKLPQYNEPTLGIILDDTLFFVSNSQWESYIMPGKHKPARKPAIISRLKLL